MADISPGQFPTYPGFESVNFITNSPAVTSESVAGKTRRVSYGHSYYTFDVKYPNLTRVQAGIVNGFVATALGPMYSFEIVLPYISYSKAAGSTTANSRVATNGNISVGARYVNLSNTGLSNGTPMLLAGDYFRFNNHSKVYMATQDCVVSAGGTANLNFSGSCVSNVPNGTGLTLNSVPFTMILNGPQQTYTSTHGGMTTMTLNMREVW